MTCPDEDSLVGFLTGSADVAVAELVERHIADCSSCLDTLEELQQSSPTPVWQRTEVSAYANEVAFMNALSLVQQVPFDESHSRHRHDLPAVEPDANDSLEFSHLGDYRILDCLGHGGMGRPSPSSCVSPGPSLSLPSTSTKLPPSSTRPCDAS